MDAFLQRAPSAVLNDSLTADELAALTLETGKYGVDGMTLRDKTNASAYGNPEITKVNIGVRGNPSILVSGHDLRDLEMLPKQTEGTGVDVYTHSEMLPAHYYPAFKKYAHYAGNYDNAWWKQKEAFGLDDINDLPILYNIAWYEQKAVIILLALLYLRAFEADPVRESARNTALGILQELMEKYPL